MISYEYHDLSVENISGGNYFLRISSRIYFKEDSFSALNDNDKVVVILKEVVP